MGGRWGGGSATEGDGGALTQLASFSTLGELHIAESCSIRSTLMPLALGGGGTAEGTPRGAAEGSTVRLTDGSTVRSTDRSTVPSMMCVTYCYVCGCMCGYSGKQYGYTCNGLPRHVPVMGCRFSLCTSNTSKSTTNTSTSSASASLSASLAKRGLQVIAVGKRAKMRDSLAKALVNAIPPFYK